MENKRMDNNMTCNDCECLVRDSCGLYLKEYQKTYKNIPRDLLDVTGSRVYDKHSCGLYHNIKYREIPRGSKEK